VRYYASTMTEDEFAQYLIRSYEGEVGSGAYFDRIATCYEESGQREKLECLARLEKKMAEWLRPMVARYGLQTRPDEESCALGINEADADSEKTWHQLITYLRDDIEPYMSEFDAFEASGADADRQALHALSQHALAFFEFTKRELAGVQPSQQPIESLLAEWR
jgi:hypothetical protein